ncbi:hypothetical protein NFI96_008973 [Prochilodus magdalenae]|nr:hypothetical protein NFI96_008973 [Prochilodus magdalenae]
MDYHRTPLGTSTAPYRDVWRVGLANTVARTILRDRLLQKPRYGKATQSILVVNPWVPFGNAYNAIDGNTDPNYNHGSCTATELQQNPWWRVDLLDEYTVTSITITNRGDCCPERINGAEIHIGNSLLDN